MLHLTSCLFATVVLHAYVKRLAAHHHVFMLLTVSSVLFHTTHGPIVRIVDKCIAHLAFGLVLLDTPAALAADRAWLLALPAGVGGLWFAQSFWPEQRERLHTALHLLSVFGVHLYIYVLY
jgi:hypothetical protein